MISPKLDAKVKAINRVNAKANQLVVDMQFKFAALIGKDILTKNGSLLAKYSHLDLNLGHPFRSWRIDSKTTFGWTIDVTEKSTDGSHFYQQTDVVIGNLSGQTLTGLTEPYTNRRTDFTCAEIMDLRQKYKDAQTLADEYKSKLARFGDFDR